MSAFDPQGLTDALVSLALSTGQFSAVNAHEPTSPAPAGVTAALWFQSIGPAKKLSGLASTAARAEYMLRIYTPMVTGQLDAIDPEMCTATAAMIGLLSEEFTLGATVFEVDLLGAYGNPLSAKAGYLQPGGLTRIMDITIPLILDDVWVQSP